MSSAPVSVTPRHYSPCDAGIETPCDQFQDRLDHLTVGARNWVDAHQHLDGDSTSLDALNESRGRR